MSSSTEELQLDMSTAAILPRISGIDDTQILCVDS